MNKYVRSFVLATLACLAASCASNSSQADAPPLFHEESAASVIMQFSNWDCILLTRPEYRVDGFDQVLKRDDLGPAFSKLGVRRDLAVVVLGRDSYGPELSTMICQWKSVLSGLGFHRVVCVRTEEGFHLNGSVILDDSRLPADGTLCQN